MFNYENSLYFIKHLSHLDAADIDIYRQQCLDKAISRNLPLYKTKLDKIIEDGLWSQEKEREVEETQNFIIHLKHSKQKLLLDKEKKIVDKEIDNYNDRLFNLIKEKQDLIGKTAEDYAHKKVNEYYLYISLYKDQYFKNRFYAWEEFDELDQHELNNILYKYNEKINPFNSSVLKKISLMPSFMNLFLLCEDDIFTFYGIPVINLTFYQIELFQAAKNFKFILRNSKISPPPEIMNDPDKLLEWFENTNKVSDIIDNNNIPQSDDKADVVGGTSIVGAKSKDYEKFGVDDKDNQALMKKLHEKGELSWQDLI